MRHKQETFILYVKVRGDAKIGGFRKAKEWQPILASPCVFPGKGGGPGFSLSGPSGGLGAGGGLVGGRRI